MGERRGERWQCISGCGACCRLDPALRGEALEALDPDSRRLYLSMVGPDGWCRHYDSGGRRCRIYEDRPPFCRVENLTGLFGGAGTLSAGTLGPGTGDAAPEGAIPEGEALAIACCRQQIRSEYGGRGRVMRRFLRAIRRGP